MLMIEVSSLAVQDSSMTEIVCPLEPTNNQSLGVSNDYNDYNRYNYQNDYDDYNDYNDYNDYSDCNDYHDVNDYNCGFWSNRTLLYFPLSVRPPFVRPPSQA